MKYFIYVSDSKLDMLLSQIDPDQKNKIESEFKVDLKLLSRSRKTILEPQNDRNRKLEVVVNFIRDYGNLGTVDAPDEYVEDSLLIRWGPHDTEGGKFSPLVYFGGITSKTILGLGGSVKHLLGNIGESPSFSASATPYLLLY